MNGVAATVENTGSSFAPFNPAESWASIVGTAPRAIVDAYGLPARQRRGFIERIIELVVHETAAEADAAHVIPDTKSADCDPQLVWALTWHARGAAWISRHRRILQQALS